MLYICEGIAEVNCITHIDLKHLKDCAHIDWVKMLRSCALLSKNSKRTVTLSISGY